MMSSSPAEASLFVTHPPYHQFNQQPTSVPAAYYTFPTYTPVTEQPGPRLSYTRDPLYPHSRRTSYQLGNHHQTASLDHHHEFTPSRYPSSFSFLTADEQANLYTRRQGDQTPLRRRQQPSNCHPSAPHAALRDMSIAHHNSISSDDVPDFMSSRRSDSTHGRNTPTTPRPAGAIDMDDKSTKMPATANDSEPSRSSMNGFSRMADLEFSRGLVGLYRTESAACQDELFNPANFDPMPPSPPRTSKNQSDHSTHTSNLVNDFVRTANEKRSQSPATAAKPESGASNPFKKGAIEAPSSKATYSPSTARSMPSAASTRRRQIDHAAQKEFDAFRPPLQREVTKTISPKDAVLDSPNLSRENSLNTFIDSIPDGYEKHLGGSQTFENNFVSGTNQAFGQYMPMNNMTANMGGFRGLDINNWLATPLAGLPNAAAAPVPTSTQVSQISQISDKSNPVFPAQLTSMESSASDHLPLSSQDSNTSSIQRPVSTAANTGTYSCPSPGCIQRFDSANKLQKHKRDAHTPSTTKYASATPEGSAQGSTQGSASSNGSDETGSESPELEPVGSGMTSSALLARNSQTGPHKCTRRNPQTGKPCNSIFSRPYDLTRHEDTIHNNKKHKVRCEYCREEKTFSRNDALTRHMRVVHPEVDFQGKRGGGRRVFT